MRSPDRLHPHRRTRRAALRGTGNRTSRGSHRTRAHSRFEHCRRRIPDLRRARWPGASTGPDRLCSRSGSSRCRAVPRIPSTRRRAGSDTPTRARARACTPNRWGRTSPQGAASPNRCPVGSLRAAPYRTDTPTRFERSWRSRETNPSRSRQHTSAPSRCSQPSPRHHWRRPYRSRRRYPSCHRYPSCRPLHSCLGRSRSSRRMPLRGVRERQGGASPRGSNRSTAAIARWSLTLGGKTAAFSL